MTGRAAGFCVGNAEAGFATTPGIGFGRGRAGRAYARNLPTQTEVKDEMNAEVAALEQRIAWLRREIDALEAQSPSEGE